jgi:acyl-CoA reductase-like NAD-dependent aldehyde dehydrogenase
MSLLPVAPFVDGEFRDSADSSVSAVVDPSTGHQIFTIPTGCDGDVNFAVESARTSFEDGRWSRIPPSERKCILNRLAELVGEYAGELDLLDAQEMGKPVGQGFCNAAAAAGMVRFCAESLDKLNGDFFPSDATSMVVQARVPRGVVGAIAPWNFPTFNALLKVAPALATGNSVVLKPSELSSTSAVKLAHLALEAGLPAGVFNLVPGLGSTVGRGLAIHNDVDMITFTGSTEVGKLMMQYAGQSNMKVVTAECGGKSPHIVFADGVDLDEVAGFIAMLITTNQGQLCTAGSRLLVERTIQSELVEKISAHLSALRIGSAIDPQVEFGPVVSDKQLNRIMGYIESAEREGAILSYGGQRVLQASGGYFVEPTIFTEVPQSSRIVQEEIFGPVLSVTAFDTEEEAVRLANGTIYGLATYIWTASLSTGMRLAKAVRTSVLINSTRPRGEGAGFAASAEPYRQSGIGTESGLGGLESYTRRQTMWFNHG